MANNKKMNKKNEQGVLYKLKGWKRDLILGLFLGLALLYADFFKEAAKIFFNLFKIPIIYHEFFSILIAILGLVIMIIMISKSLLKDNKNNPEK